MKTMIKRLAIGLTGLFVFWLCSMISVRELVMSSILMVGAILGFAGLFLLGEPKILLASIASRSIFILFFLDAAIKGFLREYFGLRPNFYIVLETLMHTDAAETKEFLLHNWPRISASLFIFVSVSVLALLYERRLTRSEEKIPPVVLSRRASILVVVTFGFFIAIHFNPSVAKENPVLHWPLRYQKFQSQSEELRVIKTQMAINAADNVALKVRYLGEEKRTVVLVIGESINRSNMSLYGYSRHTTPLLDAMRNDLIVFKDVVSPDSTTLEAMKKMLTPADIKNPDLWKESPDILMLAKKAGYKTFWISNQFVSDGWIGLMANQADSFTFINKGAGRGENNLDANLLPNFEKALADDSSKKLIVVHMLGAHQTYDMRYPDQFSKFDGVNDNVTEAMKKAGRSIWIRHLRNKYDNAILYNDYVIGSLIQLVAVNVNDQPAALIFSSDHGQEVGHTRDHAGHSSKDNSGYEIPVFVWQNQHNKTDFNGNDLRNGQLLEQRAYQTDQLDHTILGLLKIETEYYDPSQDILSSQFKQEQRYLNGLTYK